MPSNSSGFVQFGVTMKTRPTRKEARESYKEREREKEKMLATEKCDIQIISVITGMSLPE